MARRDLNTFPDRSQIYDNQINTQDLTDTRTTGAIPCAGFKQADAYVSVVHDTITALIMKHYSGGYIEQFKDIPAITPPSNIITVYDAEYRKDITANKQFKISFELNAETTEITFAGISQTVEAADFSGTGLDDATSGGTYSGTNPATYLVEIDGTGSPDTFKWTKDGGATWTAGVSIVAGPIALDSGVTIEFAATTGHTLGDQWSIRAGYGSSSDTVNVSVILR